MASPRHSRALSSRSAPLRDGVRATGWFPGILPHAETPFQSQLDQQLMRSALIAFSHVLIMHLLMGSTNTASFLTRFLRPGTHSLLCKHRVSKQVPIPCFPGLPLPPRCFLLQSLLAASARCVPCPTLAFQVLKILLHAHLS